VPQGSAAAGHVTASEKEFVISLAATTAAAGSTTFDVTNEGTVDHEFIVVKTDLPADRLPLTNGDVAEDQVSVAGKLEDVPVGTTQSLVVALQPGHYVIFCNVSGHYSAGMHQDLTVH
jgi:uncharacterized cupredoxin-like copper-binding protein